MARDFKVKERVEGVQMRVRVRVMDVIFRDFRTINKSTYTAM